VLLAKYIGLAEATRNRRNGQGGRQDRRTRRSGKAAKKDAGIVAHRRSDVRPRRTFRLRRLPGVGRDLKEAEHLFMRSSPCTRITSRGTRAVFLVRSRRSSSGDLVASH
jgi:hypothetical protein